MKLIYKNNIFFKVFILLIIPITLVFGQTIEDADSLFAKSTGQRWIATRRPDLYQPLTEHTGKEEDTRKVRFSFGQ